jgi:hypothetical protein
MAPVPGAVACNAYQEAAGFVGRANGALFEHGFGLLSRDVENIRSVRKARAFQNGLPDIPLFPVKG